MGNFSKIDVLVYGAGEHGKVVADSIMGIDDCNFVGFIDDFLPMGCPKLGFKVIGGRDVLLHENNYSIAIGLGIIEQRLMIRDLLADTGCSLVSVVDSSANMSVRAKIGKGSYIGKNTIINNNAVINDFCIINTAAVVEHDCKIGSFSEISVNACLGGGVEIGANSFIGIGATIVDHIKIGNNCIVGAGAVVLNDIPHNKLCYGVPAKIIRDSRDSQNE